MRRCLKTCALAVLGLLLSCEREAAISSASTPSPAAIAAHTPAPVIPGKWTLVNFGAPWCPVCQQLQPELAYFPKEQPNVVYHHVDIDERKSDLFQRYFRDYFKGRSIPFTVLIDPSGRAVKQWTGFLPYEEMVGQIAEIAAKAE